MTSPFHPTNWSQACVSWIHEIQIAFDPPTPVELGKGGFLRLMRWSTPRVATLVILSFTIHCTRPPGYLPLSRTGYNGATVSDGQAYVEEGVASWYGGDDDGFAGRPTASGEIFDPEQYTCAHRTLPLGSFVEVENLENHRRTVLRVNDRGPYMKGRILDLSKRGAQEIGILVQGTSRIRLRSVDAMGLPTTLDLLALNQTDPFVVQVASLSDPNNIEVLTRELENTFGIVTLQSAVTRSGLSVKRVRVGSYTTRQDAEQAAEQIAKLLKDRGVEPFITRQR